MTGKATFTNDHANDDTEEETANNHTAGRIISTLSAGQYNKNIYFYVGVYFYMSVYIGCILCGEEAYASVNYRSSPVR